MTALAQDSPDPAMVGKWVGVLEYRDYSEPATSTKRVKLQTWLTVEGMAGGLQFQYVYDDGPSKTVTELERVRIDTVKARYSVVDDKGIVKDGYAIQGLEKLANGRGTLILTGPGTENDKPVAVRTTMRIGRNILEITRETAPEGAAFMFRHAYTFVRATPPSTTAITR